MAKTLIQRVSELRQQLQNPYAYIEHLEGDSPAATPYRAATSTEIGSSRRLLENQYAHISEGGFDAVSKAVDQEAKVNISIPSIAGRPNAQAASARPRQQWSDRQIEQKVNALHRLMWQRRGSTDGTRRQADPIALLDPEAALAILDYECRPVDTIGIWESRNGVFDVAGQIDTVNRLVLVSDKFSRQARKFTVAHELGHATLHPHLGVQHRDQLLNGASTSRDKAEREANRFAIFFLMPAKLLRTHFIALFLTEKFELSEDTAFALAGNGAAKLQSSIRSVRQLARLLAEAPSYNGRHFEPLHVRFGVSRETMAIRLEELSLV